MPKNIYLYIYENAYKQQLLVIFLTLLLLPLAPIPLELQRRLMDDAVAKSDQSLLIRLGIYYIGALLLTALLKFAMRVQREYISADIVHSLRSSVYHCFYSVIPQNFWKDTGKTDNIDEGAVTSMLSSEVEKLGSFAGAAISGPLLQLGTLLVVLGYMFWIEPAVASIALLLYSPQFVIVPLFQNRLNNLARQKAITVRELSGFIVENSENDLLGKEIPNAYLSITDRIFGLRKKFILTKNTMKTLNNILISLGPFSVIVYGGWLVIQGSVEIGVIFAFVTGLEKLGGPIRDLIGSYRQITDANMRYKMLVDAFPAHAEISKIPA